LFQVEWSSEALSKFRKLDPKVARPIEKKVARLEAGAERAGKKLSGIPLWSLRVGKIRVLYSIDFAKRRVFIVTLGPRDSVYERL